MHLLQRSASLFSTLVWMGVTLIPQIGLSTAGFAADVPASAPIRIGINSAPKTLDPLLAADSVGARILHLTHPALLQYGADYTTTGLVAERCVQPNLQQVVCTLPMGRTFSDGAALTAPAVAQWLSTLQNTPRSPLAAALRGVSITTPQPHMLTFTLPSPTLAFLNVLTELPIANPSATTHGAGPYVAQQDETTGVITLTQPRTPAAPALVFTPLADPTTRLLKLKKAELDVLINDLPPSVVRHATTQGATEGITTVSTPSTGYTYLALNFKNPYLAQASVREALSLMLNRPLLRRALLDNRAQAAQSLLPPTHSAVWAAPEDPYDPFTAEGLLDDTQLPDGRTLLMGPEGARFSLTLLTSTEAFTQRLAQALQAQWREAGIDVKLESAEWGTFFSRVQAGRFDMALMTWTGEQHPGFYAQVFYSRSTPPNGFNRGQVADGELDGLLDALTTATTPEVQKVAAIAVQQRVASLRPYLPLWRRDNVLMMGKGITGCQLTASGDYRGLTSCRRID